MKRTTIIILLMLIATSTFAQPLEIMRTDRLLTASGLPRYWKGKDTNTPFIEAFRYGGNEEAKRWWTGYYEPTVSGAKTSEKARKLDLFKLYEKDIKAAHKVGNDSLETSLKEILNVRLRGEL